MDPSIRTGYLVLADITGYTLFLAGSELPHAQVILREILGLIMKNFTPTLQVAEVEGDAIFAYVPDGRLQRGETLIELIESTYLAFRDMRVTKQRMSTCTCEACHAIPTLDLKFVVHHGEFVEQTLEGKTKPLGSSVNLVHRLLKNSVSDATGWRGYLLLSEDSRRAMQVEACDMHDCTETYEHLGAVDTHSLDLEKRYRELSEARNHFIDQTDAFATTAFEVPAPPSIVWEWLNIPERRVAWWDGSGWEFVEKADGRTGRGTVNHCSQSNFTEVVLDWRPFSYFTVKRSRGFISILETTELEPVGDGTRIRWSQQLEAPFPLWLRRKLCRLIVDKAMKVENNAKKLTSMLAEEAAERRDEVRSEKVEV